MRTFTKDTYSDGKALVIVFCLSTEDKPTNGIATGSFAFEPDTGDVYAYAETSETWTKQFSFQD